MSTWRRSLRSALAAAALAATLAATAQAFDLQGHRGARGLRPENTLAAFAEALAIGVTTLELDLAVTADGVLVVSHDPYLNPVIVRDADAHWLAGKGPPIHALTAAELERYDIGRLDPQSAYARQFPQQRSVDGQRFPTLAQVFALARESGKHPRFNIETKITPTSGEETVDAATFARLAVEAVRGAGLEDRVTIESFDWRTLRKSRRIAPGIATVCLTSETEGFDTVQRNAGKPSPWHAGLALADHGGSVPRLARAADCAVWSPFWRNVSARDVAEAHALGLRVLPWTVNDPAEMARLIDMGVDGLITDYPDRLRAVMAAKGLALP